MSDGVIEISENEKKNGPFSFYKRITDALVEAKASLEPAEFDRLMDMVEGLPILFGPYEDYE